MGTFKSPTAGLVDFNNDLVGPMYESITTVWDRIFKLVLHTLIVLQHDELLAS